jgi:hypothetical protein
MNSLTNNFRIDNDLHALLSEATNYVHERAHSGSPAHEVEKGVFERMLKLGHQLFSAFFKIQGDGSVGDHLSLPIGGTVKRLPGVIKTAVNAFKACKADDAELKSSSIRKGCIWKNFQSTLL